MKTVERTSTADVSSFWDVLSNGWLFGSWVVGASRVRAVSATWPAIGAMVHHSVGAWPAVIDDDTEVVECRPDELLVLRAKLRPVGQARVEISLSTNGSGTRVSMREDFITGPARLVPEPGRQAALWLRNTESLHRLALLAEARTTPES